MAYDDMDEYTPDADVAGMYEPTPDIPLMGVAAPAGNNPDEYDLGQVVMSATQAIAPGYQAATMDEAEAGLISSGGMTAGPVASTLGSNWITETLSSAAKWYEKQDKETKGTLLSLAGSFVKGAFGYKNEERKLKSSEKTADAAMLTAQTNADATNKKFANASAIGGTNFGAKPLMAYSNKLAQRQERNQPKV